jgi:hypothetical protein
MSHEAGGSKAETFALVKSSVEAARARASSPHAILLTSDIATYDELREQGARVRGLWEFLEDEERRQVILEATALKETWYAELRRAFDYRGVNMGEALKFSVYYFLFEALSSARIAENFFGRMAPARIALKRPAGTPARYSLANASDVPEAVFSFYARRAGTSVEWLPNPEASQRQRAVRLLRRVVPRGLVSALKGAARGIAGGRGGDERPARSFPSIERAIASLGEKGEAHRAVCASCFQNFLLLLPVAAGLERTRRWRTLLIHTVPSLDYETVIKDPGHADFIAEDGTREFEYLELSHAAGGISSRGRRFARRLRRDFLAWQKSYRGDYPALFSNPALGFQFEYLLGELMEEVCAVVDAALAVFEGARPDVLLVGNGSEKDQAVAAAGRAAGVPSVLVPHNRVWAYPEVYDFPVDYVAVRNEGTARFLEGVVGERRPLVVGDLKPRKGARAAATRTRAEGDESTVSILMLVGWISPGVFQFFNIGAFYESLRALLARSAARPDFKFIFRTHPRSAALELVNEQVRRAPGYATGQLTIEAERPAEDLMAETDIVVLFDYRSSPVIAAWKAGVPVVYWRSATAFYSPDDMLREELFLTVGDFSEFEREVDRLRTNPQWRARRVAEGARLAEEYFSDPVLAEDNFARLLEEKVLRRGD